MTATYFKHILEFKKPGGTSRGILQTKETFILEISQNEKKGIGECAIFRGLSYDDVHEYEEKLQWLCENIHQNPEYLQQELLHFPSIWFGYEQAILNLKHGSDIYFPSTFTEGKKSIKINGLIWMGNAEFMQEQISEKLENGFNCIKLKIGVDWNSEKEILQKLRQKFPENQLELRVDANGGFTFEQAKTVLQELADLKIHSIEQPIKKSEVGSGKMEDGRWKLEDGSWKMEDGRWKSEVGSWKSEVGSWKSEDENRNKYAEMAELCAQTPIPIALDEELIGVVEFSEKKKLLETIQPQYIILKPSLIGGISGSNEWISLAENLEIGWWITSALESNIGLNAIAQYTFTKNPNIPQGLGTGGLFTNNFETKLSLKNDQLWLQRK